MSEAGLPADKVVALFEGFSDVQYLQVPDLSKLAAGDVPRDGRLNVLVSNHRKRYAATAAGAPVDLHVLLWNPFQVLDIAAPALVPWGHADGALAATRAWLLGQAQASAQLPVPLAMATPPAR